MSLRRFNSVQKPFSTTFFQVSASTKFEGIPSLTNNRSPPLFEFRSNLYGVLNPSIKKFPIGKLSSIFVSETINTSILLLIWSNSISNLFHMAFIFKCANTSLSGLLVHNDYRNLLQSVALLASSDSSEWHTANCLLKSSKLCQLKTLDNSFTKISLINFVPFWFKCNFPFFKWFLLILMEWSVRW